MGRVRRLHGKPAILRDKLKRNKGKNDRGTCPHCGSDLDNIFAKALKTFIRRCPQCILDFGSQ